MLTFPTNPNIGDWYVTPYGKWQWTGEVWQKYRYTMTDIQNAVTSTVGNIWTKGDTEPTSPEIGHYWLDTTDYTLYNYEGAEIGWVAVSFEESASVIPYDNSSSGIVASDVQSAIDEIVTAGIHTIQTGISFPTSGWTLGAVWYEATIDLTPYSITIGAKDSWSIYPDVTTLVQHEASLGAGVVRLDLVDASTIKISATEQNATAFNVTLEVIRDNGGAA